MDEWLAYRRIEPDAVELIVGALKRGFAALCAAQGLELPEACFDIRTEGDPTVVDASPEQQVAILRANTG